MPVFFDAYAALGVPRSATPDEIKSAFRELSKEHHPDQNGGSALAEERMKQLSAAYGVLCNETTRREHDARLDLESLRRLLGESTAPRPTAPSWEAWTAQASSAAPPVRYEAPRSSVARAITSALLLVLSRLLRGG